jgi:hypothetical protein
MYDVPTWWDGSIKEAHPRKYLGAANEAQVVPFNMTPAKQWNRPFRSAEKTGQRVGIDFPYQFTELLTRREPRILVPSHVSTHPIESPFIR